MFVYVRSTGNILHQCAYVNVASQHEWGVLNSAYTVNPKSPFRQTYSERGCFFQIAWKIPQTSEVPLGQWPLASP